MPRPRRPGSLVTTADTFHQYDKTLTSTAGSMKVITTFSSAAPSQKHPCFPVRRAFVLTSCYHIMFNFGCWVRHSGITIIPVFLLGASSPLTPMQLRAWILYNGDVTQLDSEMYYLHESSCHFQFMRELSIQSTGLAGVREPADALCRERLLSEAPSAPPSAVSH